MTGLEKILKAIETTALENADRIINEANSEAQQIMMTAKVEAESQCEEIARKFEEEIQAIHNRYESAAKLQERKILLDTKQKIIQNVIAKAKNTLTNLPDSEYFDFILRMIRKLALNQPGSIMFSAKDRNRLPKDFTDRLKEALSEKKGATLTVSDKNANIDGGFILVYGDVEENCSFEALFQAANDRLQDKVNTLLFN